MKISWYGQACFYIQGKDMSIITDPHDGRQVGLNPPDIKADIVTISHGHYDHIAGKDLVAKEDTEIITSTTHAKGIEFRSFDSFHDKEEGSLRGKNRIIKFELEGLSICHLGDLGHFLDDERIEEIGDVDILMIPVGGVYTIDAKEAFELAEKINPGIIIPMHYKVDGLTVGVSGPEEFLSLAKSKVIPVKVQEGLSVSEKPQQQEVVQLRCLAIK